jgi:hypothetical protein
VASNIYPPTYVPVELRRRKTVNPRLILVVLSTIGSTVLCFVWINSFGLSVSCGVATGLLLLPFIYRSEKTPVAPVYLTTLFLLVAYPIKLFAVRAYVPGVLEEYEGRLFNDNAVSLAMWMLSAGTISYYAGYYFAPKLLIKFLERTRLPESKKINQRWYLRLFIVCLIGWLSFLFQMSAGTWSSFAALGKNWDPRYNQVLAYLFNYVWYGIIGLAIWLSLKNLRRSATGVLISAGIILATIVAVLFLLGSKTWLMSPCLYVFAAMYVNGRKPPFWVVGSVTAVILLFAFTFVPMYRDIYLESNAGRAGTVTELAQAGSQTLNQLDKNSLNSTEASASIFNRFGGGIDNAVRVMEVVPQPLGYFYFSDLLSLPFSFVPRLIFPWKPDPETPTAYTFEVAEMRNGGSASPFPVAEGYINGGWIGVIVLFWAWGVYQSLLFNGLYLPRQQNALIQVLYIFLMIQSVSFGNWITGLFLGIMGQLVTMIPLVFILGGFRSTSLHRRVKPLISRFRDA